MGVFDDYQTPKAGGGAFAGYGPPTTSKPVSPSSASPAPTWSDWFFQHAANVGKQFQGAGQAADDYVRAITDAATFGGADWLASKLPGGGDLATERAKTAQAYERLGPIMGTVASGIGYAAGPGELKVAEKVASPLVKPLGRWASGLVGTGVEGTAAGAAGAAGHGGDLKDVEKGAAVGGALGVVSGVPGGVVGRGGELPQAPSTGSLQAAKTSLYDNLKNYPINRPNVHNAVQNAIGDIAANDPAGIVLGSMPVPGMRPSTMAMPVQAPDTRNALLKLQNWAAGPGSASAHDLSGFIRQFDQIAGDATKAGKTAEAQAARTVSNRLNSTVSGPAQDAINLADKANASYKDVQRLEDMQAKSAVAGGPDLGGQASSYLRTKQGQSFAPPSSPQYQAWNDLAATSQDPLNPARGLSYWDLKHHFLWPTVGVAATGAAGALGTMEGREHPWWLTPGEAALGLVGGLALKGRLQAARNAATGRAADAARVSLSTGKYVPPVLPDANVRDALRSVIFGAGSRGAY